MWKCGKCVEINVEMWKMCGDKCGNVEVNVEHVEINVEMWKMWNMWR